MSQHSHPHTQSNRPCMCWCHVKALAGGHCMWAQHTTTLCSPTGNETCYDQALHHTTHPLSHAYQPYAEAQAPCKPHCQGAGCNTLSIGVFCPTAHNSLRTAPIGTQIREQPWHIIIFTPIVGATQSYELGLRYGSYSVMRDFLAGGQLLVAPPIGPVQLKNQLPRRRVQ